MITKDLYTYSMIFLRQDKILRDHSPGDDSGKHRCFRLESNQAPVFRRGGGTSLTGSRESEPEPRIGLGVRKGGRFTVGGASIAHLWHGVITGYRSRAEGSTTPYAAVTP
jgi:hypothetical protein